MFDVKSRTVVFGESIEPVIVSEPLVHDGVDPDFDWTAGVLPSKKRPLALCDVAAGAQSTDDGTDLVADPLDELHCALQLAVFGELRPGLVPGVDSESDDESSQSDAEDVGGTQTPSASQRTATPATTHVPGSVTQSLVGVNTEREVCDAVPGFRVTGQWRITHHDAVIAVIRCVEGRMLKCYCQCEGHPRHALVLDCMNDRYFKAEALLVKWAIDGTAMTVEQHKRLAGEILAVHHANP